MFSILSPISSEGYSSVLKIYTPAHICNIRQISPVYLNIHLISIPMLHKIRIKTEGKGDQGLSRHI